MDYSYNLKYTFINFSNKLNKYEYEYDKFVNKIPSGLIGVLNTFDVLNYVGIMKYCRRDENYSYDFIGSGIIHKQLFINFSNLISHINIKNNKPLLFTFKSLNMKKNNRFPESNVVTLLTPSIEKDFQIFKEIINSLVNEKLNDTYACDISNFKNKY